MKNIRYDQFNNAYTLVRCKENKNGFPAGYLEIGSKLYKLEPSSASDGGMWIRVTALKKRANNPRGAF